MIRELVILAAIGLLMTAVATWFFGNHWHAW